MTETARHTTVIVNQPRKSVIVALLLTLLFGPLGMLYSTVTGGIVMLVLTFILTPLTYGMSLLLTWPICMIWGGVAAARSGKSTTTTV